MAISGIYTSETNLLNNIKVQAPSAQSAKTEEIESQIRHEKSNNVKSSKKYLYAGVGIVALLSILLMRGGKLLKSIQKLLSNEVEKPYHCVSLPDNKVIDVEVVDTRFLSPRSKLRMRPEIVDVDFEEIV